jgi:hypothetical protein
MFADLPVSCETETRRDGSELLPLQTARPASRLEIRRTQVAKLVSYLTRRLGIGRTQVATSVISG